MIIEETEDTNDALKPRTLLLTEHRWLAHFAQWRETKDELQSCCKLLKILFKRNATKVNIKHFQVPKVKRNEPHYQ